MGVEVSMITRDMADLIRFTKGVGLIIEEFRMTPTTA